jgi:hypothetical protein
VPAAQELENLVVRLTGDGSEYQQMLQRAQTQTTETAAHVEAATARIEQHESALKGFGETVVASLEALGIERFLHGAFEAFGKRENTLIDLTAAIRMNGEAVDEVMPKYQRWADQIAASTTIGRNQALNLISMASAYGLTGDAAQRAAQNALAFSAAPGARGGPETLLRMSAALEQGNVKMAMHMGRLIPALRGVKDEAEFLAKAQKILKEGTEIMNEKANTAEGVITRLGNAWTEFKADLGETVSEGIKPAAEWLAKAVTALRNLDPETKKAGVQIALIAAAFLAAGPAIKIASFALSPFVALIKLLVVDLVLGTAQTLAHAAAWVVWKVAVLAASAVTLVFKAAVWLLNAALTTTGILMLALVAPVVLAGVALILAGIGGIAGAATATYAGMAGLVGQMKTLFLNAPLFGTLVGWFKEWRGVIKDIVEVARRGDFENLGKLLGAAFQVAKLEIQSLWPPLWAFFKVGWQAAVDVALASMKAGFAKGFLDTGEKIYNFLNQFNLGMNNAEAERLRQKRDALRRDAALELENAKQVAEANINEAAKGLRVQESDELKAAKDRLNQIRALAAGAGGLVVRAAEAAAMAAVPQKAAAAWKDAASQAKAYHDAVNQVLAGSAEARTRLLQFQVAYAGSFQKPAGQPVPAGGAAGGAEANRVAAAQLDTQNSILAGINALVEQGAKGPKAVAAEW